MTSRGRAKFSAWPVEATLLSLSFFTMTTRKQRRWSGSQRFLFRVSLAVLALVLIRYMLRPIEPTKASTKELKQASELTPSESKSITLPTSVEKLNSNNNDSPLFHIIVSTGDETISTLNMRCIESIFYFHPKARLYIHTPVEGGLSSGLSHPKLAPLVKKKYDISIKRYKPQVVLKAAMMADDDKMISKSAAERFLNNLDALQKEKFWYSNETNLLRMCLLFLQGGIYLDTDVILITNVLGSDARIDNVMGRNKQKFHCAVMKFTQPKNKFLAATINNFLENYNGTKWGNNGPLAFGRTSLEHPELVCKDDNFDYLHNNKAVPEKEEEKNCWLNPLPNEAFAPVSYKQFGDVCFRNDSPTGDEALQYIENSYAVHFNNKATGKELKAKEYRKGTLCDVVLKSYCILCQD